MRRTSRPLSKHQVGVAESDHMPVGAGCVLDPLAVRRTCHWCCRRPVFRTPVCRRNQDGVVSRGQHVWDDDVVVDSVADGGRVRWRRRTRARRWARSTCGGDCSTCRSCRRPSFLVGVVGPIDPAGAHGRVRILEKRTLGVADVDGRPVPDVDRKNTLRFATNIPFMLELSIAIQSTVDIAQTATSARRRPGAGYARGPARRGRSPRSSPGARRALPTTRALGDRGRRRPSCIWTIYRRPASATRR